MVDLDHFKHFNDTFGHEVGDMLVREFGKIVCRRVVKAADTALYQAKHGGRDRVLLAVETYP